MKSSKPLTISAYMLRKGSKRERAQLEQGAARVVLRVKEGVSDAIDDAAALESVGVKLDLDESLPELLSRASDDPRAVSVLVLARKVLALRNDTQSLQDAPREAAAKRGAIGGKKTDELAKNLAGLTSLMAKRKARFEVLRAEGKTDAEALDMIAVEEDREPQAVRQSLKAAGVVFSTKSRQGRRR